MILPKCSIRPSPILKDSTRLDCGSSRKHRRRHWWIAAYELFDSRKERSRIQPYARNEKKRGMREKSYHGLATYLPTRRLFFWLALRYGFIDKSILVVTEGLGPQKFHGRVVDSRERAHCERRRNGCCIRRGEWACHYRWHENAGPLVERHYV